MRKVKNGRTWTVVLKFFLRVFAQHEYCIDQRDMKLTFNTLPTRTSKAKAHTLIKYILKTTQE